MTPAPDVTPQLPGMHIFLFFPRLINGGRMVIVSGTNFIFLSYALVFYSFFG